MTSKKKKKKKKKGVPEDEMVRWLGSITNSMDMNWTKLQETVKDREAWHAAVHGIIVLDRT